MALMALKRPSPSSAPASPLDEDAPAAAGRSPGAIAADPSSKSRLIKGRPGETRATEPPPPVELPSLVARAAEGDVAAFNRLVAAYQSKVMTFALAFTSDRDQASDVAQEALIKVYRSIGSFRFQSSFSTWLFSIVRNVFLDHYKSRSSRQRALETPLDSDPELGLTELRDEAAHAEERLLREDERRALWAALRGVPVAYRMVVVMFDVQGMSYDEIARSLELPVGTVKSRLKRGRDALRVQVFRSGASDRGARRREEP
jgi:RNA polymerase sigma-70 factor (ECF subfamily)